MDLYNRTLNRCLHLELTSSGAYAVRSRAAVAIGGVQGNRGARRLQQSGADVQGSSLLVLNSVHGICAALAKTDLVCDGLSRLNRVEHLQAVLESFNAGGGSDELTYFTSPGTGLPANVGPSAGISVFSQARRTSLVGGNVQVTLQPAFPAGKRPRSPPPNAVASSTSPRSSPRPGTPPPQNSTPAKERSPVRGRSLSPVRSGAVASGPAQKSARNALANTACTALNSVFSQLSTPKERILQLNVETRELLSVAVRVARVEQGLLQRAVETTSDAAAVRRAMPLQLQRVAKSIDFEIGRFLDFMVTSSETPPSSSGLREKIYNIYEAEASDRLAHLYEDMSVVKDFRRHRGEKRERYIREKVIEAIISSEMARARSANSHRMDDWRAAQGFAAMASGRTNSDINRAATSAAGPASRQTLSKRAHAHYAKETRNLVERGAQDERLIVRM